MDSGAKLDQMANQIAAFFKPYPAEEALAGVHEHILAFWTPGMRKGLRGRIESGAAHVDPLVIGAFEALASGKSPARKEAAGPAQVGEIGASDAG